MSVDHSGVIAVGAGSAGAPGAQYAGAVYIFRFDRDASAWREDAQIVNSDAQPGQGGNGVPDECDVAAGSSADCNRNGIPDDCEPDCNGNGAQDGCDIGSGPSRDCDDDRIPDECDLEYALDDGSPDMAVGPSGPVARDVLRMNRFIVAPGRETIAAAGIAWPKCRVPGGAALTVLLYRDPNNDGDPLDAELLSSTVTSDPPRARPGEFVTVPVAPTVVGRAGDTFLGGHT